MYNDAIVLFQACTLLNTETYLHMYTFLLLLFMHMVAQISTYLIAQSTSSTRWLAKSVGLMLLFLFFVFYFFATTISESKICHIKLLMEKLAMYMMLKYQYNVMTSISSLLIGINFLM